MQDPAFARRKTWPAEQQPQVGLGHMINSTCRLAQPEARGLPVQLEVPTKHAPRRNGTVTACGPLQWIQFLVHAEGNMSVRFHASGTCHPSMALTTRYTTTASPGRGKCDHCVAQGSVLDVVRRNPAQPQTMHWIKPPPAIGHSGWVGLHEGSH